jgi:hypothetical protein
MSDFNEVVKRVTTDRAFRADLLKDLKGTLSAHNYTVSGAEFSELSSLDEAKLDQLDEALMDQVVGGLTSPLNLSTTSLNTMPLLTTSLNSVNLVDLRRPGGFASGSGTW